MIALAFLAMSLLGPHCRAFGLLPDRVCSPGAIDPTVTLVTVCVQSTKARRHVSNATKRAVLAEYGVAWADRRAYEVDHVVPLALAGSNSMANLAAQPIAEAHRKDVAEERARLRVCSGRETLAVAQRNFMQDWTLEEKR